MAHMCLENDGVSDPEGLEFYFSNRIFILYKEKENWSKATLLFSK